MLALLHRTILKKPDWLATMLVLCAPGLLWAQRPNAVPETLDTPVGVTEVGVLAGAQYRIDVPKDWNHKLVVFYHGYSMHGVTFHVAEELKGQPLPMFERHYAVAESAYSQSGWAVEQAYPETETLRRYFGKAYGVPKETYLAGASMGGALTMITLELNPKPYMGALDLCGAVGPTYESFERRFALRAAFDFYFPGVMPKLVPSPEDYDATPAVRAKIAAALKANPAGAAALRGLMSLHADADVAYDLAYYTFVITEMQKRAGGNPFDNRNYIYTGASPTSSADDDDLNDHVRRYSAEPKARDYLYRHFTPIGVLHKPMLAVHTVYDPLVPAGSLSLYAHLVEGAGFEENLVQQYVHHDGHCAVSPEEIGRAFDELVTWTHGGARPAPGLLR